MIKNKRKRETVYKPVTVGFIENISSIISFKNNVLNVLLKNPFYFIITLIVFGFIYYIGASNSDVNMVVDSNIEGKTPFSSIGYSGDFNIWVYFLPLFYLILFFNFFAFPHFRRKNYVKGFFVFMSPKLYFVISLYMVMYFIGFWMMVSFFYNVSGIVLPVDYEQMRVWFSDLSIFGRFLLLGYVVFAVLFIYVSALSFYMFFFLSNVKNIGIINSIMFSLTYINKNFFILFFNTLMIVFIVLGLSYVHISYNSSILNFFLSSITYIYLVSILYNQSEMGITLKYKS